LVRGCMERGLGPRCRCSRGEPSTAAGGAGWSRVPVWHK
jgi:hypothetical protein